MYSHISSIRNSEFEVVQAAAVSSVGFFRLQFSSSPSETEDPQCRGSDAPLVDKILQLAWWGSLKSGLPARLPLPYHGSKLRGPSPMAVVLLSNWPAIKAFRAKTEQNLNNLLREYKDIFDDKLGEINNYEAKLKLRHGVKPIFCRVRTVPFALKGRVENEIDRLEKEGIIEKVDSSEWATPVVPVVKSYGSIRLCAYYSVT
ncbi:retrovirus-related Pol polyprotein from transposon 412 [Trichonephila clavipes]|nr:retrovirus-related Pol polyprotein from transposon 412 [Trichonephila clavipes]